MNVKRIQRFVKGSIRLPEDESQCVEYGIGSHFVIDDVRTEISGPRFGNGVSGRVLVINTGYTGADWHLKLNVIVTTVNEDFVESVHLETWYITFNGVE